MVLLMSLLVSMVVLLIYDDDNDNNGVDVIMFLARVSCVAASTVKETEQPCSKTEERLRTLVEDNTCKLILDEITLEDAGLYQCMLGAIVASDLVKGSQSMEVEVAREASLQFEGSISEADPDWVLVEGEEVTASCSSLGGTPRPTILGYLGEDLLEADTEEGEEDVTVTFSLSPSRAESGNYLKCSSQQTDGDGLTLFSGPQEISKKVR